MLAGVAAYGQCAGCFQCRWAPIFYQLWWIEVAMGWMSTPASYPLILRSLACVTNLFFSELWHCRVEWDRGGSAGGESSREEGKMEAAAAVAALPKLCVCNGGYVEWQGISLQGLQYFGSILHAPSISQFMSNISWLCNIGMLSVR
jgi:hypothetical protein